MPANGIFAVIPVKRFSAAKQRLSPFLSASERVTLARAMFEDVLAAANSATSLSGVLVVTCDAEAAAIAIKASAALLTEPGQYGYAPAVNMASRELKRRGADGIVVIPIDIPHITSSFIDDVVTQTPSPGVTMVQAHSDGGTNLLAIRPCGFIPPQFGPNSLARHAASARGAGVEPLILTASSAGIDLDLPQDLLDFLALNTPTRSHRLLATLNIAERKRDGTG
jgi:2-phospho-L-lactate/phosphoenolpyruvate guanylyltransferase